MPLVVDLLLLDEEEQPSQPVQGQIATAKGLFAELQRQLQEPNSHLKRKSALGALIGRGASVHYLGSDILSSEEKSHILCGSPSVLADSVREGSNLPGVREDVLGQWSKVPELGARRRTCPGAANVPPILDFPQPRSRSMVPLLGMDFVSSLFNWMPSCAPVSCKTLEAKHVDTCSIIVAPLAPDNGKGRGGTCVPDMPSEESTGRFEAGLGGWPLCVPVACAAFPPVSSRQVGGATSSSAPAVVTTQVTSSVTSAALLASPPPSGAYGPQMAAGRSSGSTSVAPESHAASDAAGCMKFRRAAIEVDDTELAVILAPPSRVAAAAQVEHRCSSSCGSSVHVVETPSTTASSTIMDSTTRMTASPSSPWETTSRVTNYCRVVLPRDSISSVRQGPQLLNSSSASSRAAEDCCQQCHRHLVEVVGIPQGGTAPMILLLALPKSSLATRIHEALLGRYRPRPVPGKVACKGAANEQFVAPIPQGSHQEALRCELQMNVEVTLGSVSSEVNCAAVIRRGICEACHVGSERVHVCRLLSTQPEQNQQLPGDFCQPEEGSYGGCS